MPVKKYDNIAMVSLSARTRVVKVTQGNERIKRVIPFLPRPPPSYQRNIMKMR